MAGKWPVIALLAPLAAMIAGSCSVAQSATPVSDSDHEATAPSAASTASASSVQSAGGEPAASRATVPASSEPASYRIIGVGDIMMGSDWPQPGMDPRITPSADPEAVLGPALTALFDEADVVFGNYEGTIHASSQNAKNCSNPSVCYVFRSPVFHAAYLRRAGFTIMSNANNHARDFGETGRQATYANLTAAGIPTAGGDVSGMRIATQRLDDGRTVALVAFGHNPGLLMVQDYSRVAEMVREADSMADIVMVSCHIGAEGSAHNRVTRETETYLGENRGNPYRFAHAAVDAGADVVFCHGPHVPRAVEVYRGRFIAYSLGNFWTYGRFNLNGHNGLAPIADIQVDGEGALLSARIVSARQDRPGGPYADISNAAAQRVAELTARDMADSGTRVDATGRVSWPGAPGRN